MTGDHRHGQSMIGRIKRMMAKSMHGMLTCREMDDFMVDYFDGKLPTGTRLSFDLHLRLCPRCREYVRGYRKSMELTRRVFEEPDAEVPAEVPAELVSAILDARRRQD